MSLVPRLRFKGFVGDWVEKKLGDMTKIKAGGTPNTEHSEYWGGTIRWMNSGELNLKQVFDVKNRITELGLQKSSTNIIPKYCILVGLAGQGKTRGTVAINHIELCTNQSIASIFPSPYYISQFIYYNLDGRYQELRLLSGNSEGRGGLNLGHLNNLKVNLPTLAEQQKIASFLTAIDKKIEGLQKKENLLKKYKQGVLQKIFNQEIRFKQDDGSEFPAWVEKKLGEVCSISTGKSNRQDSSLWGDFFFFDRSQDIRRSNIFLFDCEVVIVPGEGQSFIPKYYIGKFDLHQRTYAIMNFNEIIGKFVFFYIEYHQHLLLSKAVGSTVKSLRLPIFKDLPINFPPLAEQQKIANFLTALDQKISLTTTQLEKTKQYKTALLQQLFI